VADVRAAVGLTVQDIGRRIVEWSAKLTPGDEPGTTSGDIESAPRAREFGD
jgi:hypothetical protein